MTTTRPAHWPPTLPTSEPTDPTIIDNTPVNEPYDGLDYRLTFTETEPRSIWSGGIDGPPIPDARTGIDTSGDWSADLDDYDRDPVFHVLAAAVGECVHEALEWAQLDDAPILDPHGPMEHDIHGLVHTLNKALFELAKQAATKRTAE